MTAQRNTALNSEMRFWWWQVCINRLAGGKGLI